MVGFGFGPIQGGLFGVEAFKSGDFERIVIAEIDQALVDAVRANNGAYFVNVGTSSGIEVLRIDNVELLNPGVDRDKIALQDALRQATEIATCLPSVTFFEAGGADSVAALIADGLRDSRADATIIYAAENNNYAAEILEEKVSSVTGGECGRPVQYLNTVIGKMSQVVTDPGEIERMKLTPIAPGINKAFLVEEFNRIFVTRCSLGDFSPGIKVFIEKDDLVPFEEAKLYGHNAIHALIAYLGGAKGYIKMTDVTDDKQLMTIARDAFLNESGGALIKKYAGLGDELFTIAGYRDYAEDLLIRMVNPYLSDTIARAGRDPVRKLGRKDRIFGTMSLALQQGVRPENMALGALAGIVALLNQAEEYNVPRDMHIDNWRKLDIKKIEAILKWIWENEKGEHDRELVSLVHNSITGLSNLIDIK